MTLFVPRLNDFQAHHNCGQPLLQLLCRWQELLWFPLSRKSLTFVGAVKSSEPIHYLLAILLPNNCVVGYNNGLDLKSVDYKLLLELKFKNYVYRKLLFMHVCEALTFKFVLQVI